MARNFLAGVLALALTAGSAHGQTPPAAQPDPHVRALAAGYKAAFLCSGLFNAGQTPEQIAADDLEGIYPDYQALVRELPADIDRSGKSVSVAFDPKLPPRVAVWRPALGCAQLPVGAPPPAAAHLPRFAAQAPELDRRRWPQGEAQASAPTPARLKPVLARAFDGRAYGAKTRTTAVLILKDGKIVGEQYRDGYGPHVPQRTWSVAKSLTATVVGRAVQLGLVDVTAPANIPEWRAPGDPRAQITLAQLLQMNSGLWTDGPGSRTDEVYLGGALVTQTAAAMPLEAAPGSRFRYANNDTLLAARAVRAALGDGERALRFPFEELLWKVGMTRTTPETDWQGNFILSSQVWTTARDLARLGQLYLQDGVWNGERILPAGWARFVATPAPAQPPRGEGYGAAFWLYKADSGLPDGTYGMNGNRGQHVVIVPARGVVVVRRGFDPHAVAFDEAAFARDVLAALP